MSTANLEQNQQLLEQEYDSTVRADIEEFREHSQAWLDKKITDDQFRAQRLRRGIYGQRQDGVQMIRTKIPEGSLAVRPPDQEPAVSRPKGLKSHGRLCWIILEEI